MMSVLHSAWRITACFEGVDLSINSHGSHITLTLCRCVWPRCGSWNPGKQDGGSQSGIGRLSVAMVETSPEVWSCALV